jgi:hypothetical protein
MVTSDFVSLERGLPPGGAPIPPFNTVTLSLVLPPGLRFHGPLGQPLPSISRPGTRPVG